MRFITFSCLCLVIVLTACSGSDTLNIDTTPPIPPDLVNHRGDLGDGVYDNNGQDIVLTDDNNGIDAIPDGDWIKIPWEHFLDTDLAYVKIFRYDEFEPEPVLIDSIRSDNEYYVDISDDISTHVRYSYYIEVVDNDGNSAVSDTVSYVLLSKQLLVSPAQNAYALSSDITFSWQRSGYVSKVRVLVFDENHQYLWHRDINVALEDDVMTLSMPSNWQQSLGYEGNAIYWRVDAFEMDTELGIFAGSESNERILNLIN